jgi:hypothetical protein
LLIYWPIHHMLCVTQIFAGCSFQTWAAL